jgi:uncharacterized protein (TIGR03000 family)
MFCVKWSVAAVAFAAAGLWLAGGMGRARAADPAKAAEQPVVIDMQAPAGAEVWFDDAKTNSRGARRQFVTPPLEAGREFNYTVRVHWEEAGRPFERTQRVTVHAGDHINLDYSEPNGAVVPAAFEVERAAAPEVRRSFYQPAVAPTAPAAVESRPAPAIPPRYYDPGPPAGPPASNDPLSTGVGNG